MAIYVDKREIADADNLDGKTLQYVLSEHQKQAKRLNELKDAYMARNLPHDRPKQDDVSVVVDYPRYIVETTLGYYLGDPIKYKIDDEQSRPWMGGRVRAAMRNGEAVKPETLPPVAVDADKILAAYDSQTISEIDADIGRNLGIYGEAYEVIYRNAEAQPRSAVCDPRCSVMVRDTTVEHNRLFFLTWIKRTGIGATKYYQVYVYGPKYVTEYRSSSVRPGMSWQMVDQQPHFFGEVPAVEYSNNSDRLGDFETQLTLINAYNTLMSDRCTDKRKFIDAILALFGASLSEEDYKRLKDEKFIDELPVDAKLEYIQRVFDESSIHILADDLVREIHKQSMTVDLSDEQFAGNSSGQALKLKLLTLTMLVKGKMRSFEKGLKKRFDLYSIALYGLYGPRPDKEACTPIFTLQLPLDEQGIVNIVTSLQNIVDDETLLGLLWFVRDPEETLEKVRKQKEENRAAFVDAFGAKTEADEKKPFVKDDDDEDDEA